MSTLTYTGALTVVSCHCGIVYAIPDNLDSQAHLHKGREVYCPLGHRWVYRDSFEQQLERERQRHQATRDLLRAEERSHAATRGQVTKLRKRVAAGVCPCCHRTFQQLARHMAAKHPDWKREVA